MCHWWQWQIAFLLEHPEAISVMAFCMPSIIFPLIQNLTAFLFSFLWLLIVLLQRNVCPVKSYLMESDRKVKPTVTNYAIKPQKATRWQTSQISEGTGAVLLFHYPLTSLTYAGAYFSISRSPSVCLIMHRLTESSILPLLLSLLLRANAFDVFIGSLGVQCVCFVCAHQCHCYLCSTSSAPNCRAKTGAVGTDALNPHPIFTLSNRSGKEKERERWRHWSKEGEWRYWCKV